MSAGSERERARRRNIVLGSAVAALAVVTAGLVVADESRKVREATRARAAMGPPRDGPVPTAEQPAADDSTRAPPPRGRLTGIAVWQTTQGYRVCVRADLHGCRVRAGTDNGQDRVFRETDIRAVESCETQFQTADERCRGAGDPLGDEPARVAAAACAAQWGVLRSELVTLSDPRDEHLPDGRLRIDCDEGFYDVGFSPRR